MIPGSVTGAIHPRPSHHLPRDVFDALAMLEYQVRRAEKANPQTDPQGFMKAVREQGVARDHLATVILTHLHQPKRPSEPAAVTLAHYAEGDR